MDPKKWEDKGLKYDSASDIKRQNEFVDPRYKLNVPPVAKTRPNGHLVLVRLEPVNSGEFPSFDLRWDQNANTIDVDLDGDPVERKLFEAGREGYQGHHPVTVSDTPRVFHIEIRNREFTVYESDLTCVIGLTVEIEDRL